MTAIRPDLSPFAPRASTTSPGAQNAAHTAQAAFFRMALGQTTTATPASVSANQAQTTSAASTPAAPRTADPERPLRPGSLLDIRV